MEISNDTSWDRTSDIPNCSTAIHGLKGAEMGLCYVIMNCVRLMEWVWKGAYFFCLGEGGILTFL